MHMKLAWHLLSMDSLWSHFVLYKYGRGSHLSLMVPQSPSTRLWRSVVVVILEDCEYSKVNVREGQASFWFYRWITDGPLCVMLPTISHPNLKISDAWIGNQWDFDLLMQLVGEELTTEVGRKICAGRTCKDILISKPTLDEQFTLTNLIRVKGECCSWMY